MSPPVDVAKKFFGFHEDAMMQAYVEDGRQFIEKCKAPYDIIFLDGYGQRADPLPHGYQGVFPVGAPSADPQGASW
jgi:spermidine synthase